MCKTPVRRCSRMAAEFTPASPLTSVAAAPLKAVTYRKRHKRREDRQRGGRHGLTRRDRADIKHESVTAHRRSSVNWKCRKCYCQQTWPHKV